MARNKKKELTTIKEKVKNATFSAICAVKDEMEEKIEKLEKIAKVDEEKEINLPLDDFIVQHSVTGRTLIKMVFNDVIEINHITRETSEFTLGFMERYVKFINDVCGCSIVPTHCKMLCKPLDLVIQYNEKINDISISSEHNSRCGTLSRLYRELDGSDQNKHPHIQSSGCLGGYSSLLINALRNRDVLSFTTTLKRYLNSVDVLDLWGAKLITTNYLLYDYVNNIYYLMQTSTTNYSNMILAFTLPNDDETIHLKWQCFFYSPQANSSVIHTARLEEVEEDIYINKLQIRLHNKEAVYISQLNPLNIYLNAIEKSRLKEHVNGGYDTFVIKETESIINSYANAHTKTYTTEDDVIYDEYNEEEGW